MSKKKISLVAVAAILFLFLLFWFLVLFKSDVKAPTTKVPETSSTNSSSAAAAPNLSSPDEMLKNALNLYIKKKAEGVDMKNGPCLGSIGPDWVLDIAHNPRQATDDKVENQCADFRTGAAHHFIELDPDGRLIKSY